MIRITLLLVTMCACTQSQTLSPSVQKKYEDIKETGRNTGAYLPFGWGTGVYTTEKAIPTSWFAWCRPDGEMLSIVVDVPLRRKNTDVTFSLYGRTTIIEMRAPACGIRCDNGDCNSKRLLQGYLNRVTRRIPQAVFTVKGDMMPFNLSR